MNTKTFICCSFSAQRRFPATVNLFVSMPNHFIPHYNIMSKESSHFKSLINRAITIALYFFYNRNFYIIIIFIIIFLTFVLFFISWNQYLVSCMLYPVSSRDGQRFCERIFFFLRTNKICH